MIADDKDQILVERYKKLNPQLIANPIEAYEKSLLEAKTVAPLDAIPVAPIGDEAFTDQHPNVTPMEPTVAPVLADDNNPTWKQRWSTLQGMYDADVHRVTAQNRELNQLVNDLNSTVDALKVKQREEIQVSSVTDRDTEQFGAELIDLQRRVASEMVTPLTNELNVLKSENARLLAQVGQTGTEVASMSFESKLRQVIGDFDAVNTNPSWVSWLNEVDPILRAPRRTVAQVAFESGDALAVKEYVDLWRKTVPLGNTKAETLQDELRSQVTPTRNSPAVPNAEGKKTYTAAEADKAWARVTLLGRNGKYEEANKLDNELTEAYMQGRVKG